ncbi:histidine kinase [Marinobacterium nitratireducens]|uniref:Sensor protein n=1 Tax=Marinobacterium nitratireducens TaxID=518897 RepID=A0A917Z9F1_9GAMM|nr:type IV pili methyl-accepting chemotaxis transducer N-terminal domain-containing protein [Marinobacterium nitratireducens]GGO76543.1 histidine kinase [Marinobacterium nitratireducens]
MRILKNSIIARFGAAMFAISLMALVSMIGSVLVAESTQGNAAGINLAGSLRMLSYRLQADTQQYLAQPDAARRTRLEQDLALFEERLRSPVLSQVVPEDPRSDRRRQFGQVLETWQQQLRPRLERVLADPASFADRAPELPTDAFVLQIDRLVQLVEGSTESKIRLLSLVQAISLFFTLVVIGIAIFDIKFSLVNPLHQLVQMARRTSRGDFGTRVSFQSQDELGVLGGTLNQMADELSRIYADLEQRVERKTSQLRQTNQQLQLLYETTRRFNHSDDICHSMMPVLKQLESLSPFSPISVTLHEPLSQRRYRHLTTQATRRPPDCQDSSCDSCLVPALDDRPRESLSIPIRKQGVYFGDLSAEYRPDRAPDASSIALLETIVENLASALSLELKAEQEQKLSLVEERNVIARELHDSLAQSLSYLKMQVGRLQLLQRKGADAERIDEVVEELRNGLNNAYRQLRELLTTFRLKLDQPSLEAALLNTVEEFSARLEQPVELHYDTGHLQLNPNEEIHLLQLVREALANVVKHAQASQVSVCVRARQNRIEAVIEDNGVGLPAGYDSSQHHGLIIMRDRSNILGGELTIGNRESGGVRVQLTFSPHQIKSGNNRNEVNHQ